MKIYLKVLPLIFFNAISCANHVLENIVILNDGNQAPRFFNISQHAATLKSVSLVFKSMSDCRGSDVGHLQLDSYAGIPLVKGQIMAIGLNDKLKAHSVLIYFLNQKGDFATFVKGCRLKDDNDACCENIHCHPSEPNCSFSPKEKLQRFYFAKKE